LSREKAAREQAAHEPSDVRQSLLAIYAINDAMNQVILAGLDARAWRVKPPSRRTGEGRTIAAIFAHLHNCRLVWLRHSAPHIKRPAPLDPARSTMKQAAVAHKKSAACCLRMLEEALGDSPRRRIRKFSRGAWMPEWNPTGTMFAYMFAHEAHHRGQIIMLAHQLGYRLPVASASGVWWWDKLWKQAGIPRPR
jgi:uncharacterized damage-inducible protein DinB